MGHDLPTMIGVDHSGLSRKIHSLVPDYMVMGERGMADMTEMTMPLPENTVPMMTGDGPYGSVEMGGMFSVIKVRSQQKKGDYTDPGWYKQPKGTQAFEYQGIEAPPMRSSAESGKSAMKSHGSSVGDLELKVRKPNTPMNH
jgi:hypothetical protein